MIVEAARQCAVLRAVEFDSIRQNQPIGRPHQFGKELSLAFGQCIEVRIDEILATTFWDVL
jgi:hypothetical protein